MDKNKLLETNFEVNNVDDQNSKGDNPTSQGENNYKYIFFILFFLMGLINNLGYIKLLK
jgi:hypothetical protein